MNEQTVSDAIRLYSSGVISRKYLESAVQAWDVPHESFARTNAMPGEWVVDLHPDTAGVWR